MGTCPGCGADIGVRAAFCSGCGRRLTPAAPGRTTRRLVTVLFADVVGSTALGERMDPEALRRVMGIFLARMRDVVDRHLGTTEPLIGDSVMAVFGSSVAREDDALRAVRAATEMLAALRELNRELSASLTDELALRIGVNTGEVVTSSAETAIALGDVLGDAVNVASRLQAAAGPGEILIGGLTHSLVRNWVAGERVELTLRGRSHAVRAFRLDRVTPPGAMTEPTARTAMVGRARELAQLRNELDAVHRGIGARLVTVLGEAGVGKSRLLWEFTRDLDPQTVLRSRCLSYGAALTYWPLAEFVRQGLGAVADADGLRRAIGDRCGDRVDADRVALVLATALGFDQSRASAVEIAWASRELLGALASYAPRILVIDDLQWADPTFLDLVEFLATAGETANLLVVCMARPELLEQRAEWPGTAIRLEPLGSEAFEHLVGALLPGSERVGALAARVAAAAGGNPLFAEELVAMLVDQGVLERSGETWVVAADVDRLELPATIDIILAARIDRLDAAQRDAIETAAVIGQTFTLALVGVLLPEASASDVESAVAALQQRNLVRRNHERTDGRFDDLRFHHQLIRDAVYRAISKARRADLHARLATHLESVVSSAPEMDEIIGHHYLQARSYREQLGFDPGETSALGVRASAHFAAAGNRAVNYGDVDTGRALLTQAAELLPAGHEARADVLLELGCAIAYGIDPRAGIEVLTEAEQAARAKGDAVGEWRARLNVAMARTGTDPEGSTDALFAAADAAEQAFGDEQNPVVLAEVWRARAAGHNMHSAQGERAVALERAMAYDEQAGVPNATRRHANDLAGALAYGPTPVDAAIRRIKAMLADASPSVAIALHARCTSLATMRGDRDLADRHAAHELAIRQQLGITSPASFQAAVLADLVGDHESAVGHLLAVARACEEVDDFSALTGTLALLAVQLVRLGRIDEAFDAVQRCDELSATDDHINFVWSRSALASILVSRGDSAAAVPAAREAVRHADMTDAAIDKGDAYVALGRALAANGQSVEALAALRQAREIYTAKQAYVRTSRVDEVLAGIPAPIA